MKKKSPGRSVTGRLLSFETTCGGGNETFASFDRVGNAPPVVRGNRLRYRATRGALPTRLNEAVWAAREPDRQRRQPPQRLRPLSLRPDNLALLVGMSRTACGFKTKSRDRRAIAALQVGRTKNEGYFLP